MKKIAISNFRKKHGQELFNQLQASVKNSSFRMNHDRNSLINISQIIKALPDNEIKTKFINWSSGYDFAVIDII
jgi:hypothetical protein